MIPFNFIYSYNCTTLVANIPSVEVVCCPRVLPSQVFCKQPTMLFKTNILLVPVPVHTQVYNVAMFVLAVAFVVL